MAAHSDRIMVPERPSKRRSREDRRAEISSIAARLFAEHGYHATGMAELGEAVGLGRGALYHHISSKEELLFEISSRHVEDMVVFGETLLERADIGAVDKLRALSARLMRTIADNLPELTVFFRDAASLTGGRRTQVIELRDRFEDVWAGVVAQGVDEAAFRSLDPVAIKGMLGLHNYSYIWLSSDGRLSPEEISEVFCDLLFAGLVPS